MSELELREDGELVLDVPVELPDVLDILIVGGGPAGTATAFRARELGLKALVVDYDDLLKRIRDYAKDKPILPNFGGGDKMGFPRGGELVAQLEFEAIDKDEMCRRWKGLYRSLGIPARIGVEVTGIGPRSNGARTVQAWNHRTNLEESYVARHVVLAFGRGVPRRFDIGGDQEGISFRLTDPSLYCGRPACVVGGGTSAAEAVIALSNCKVQASDPTGVYWSYRGDKMPKVSKALSEVFFQAYVGNGNVRYLPHSEPTAIVRREDGSEHLSICTDRKLLADRPAETTYLEFPKNNCIACIGEDIPEELMRSLGIEMVTGGPRNKKRMAVTPLMETALSHVYLIGDVLSPVFLQPEAFGGDPSKFPEVKRRGNIKAALTDGVLVAEVIAQRQAGKSEIHVELDFTPPTAPETAEATDVPTPVPAAISSAAQETAPTARLVHLLRGEVEAEEYPLADGVKTIGTKDCDICFTDDPNLTEKHASIIGRSGNYFLKDEGSARGVFLQATEGKQIEIATGTVVKTGEQWLVFGGPGSPFRLLHYDHRGREQGRFELEEKTVVLGRRAPQITLDPQDDTLSRRHIAVSRKGDQVYIRDLNSINGTFIKISGEVELADEDEFFLGQQHFRFTTSDEVSTTGVVHVTDTGAVPEEPVQAVDSEQAIRVSNRDVSVQIRPGRTVCELLEEEGVRINAECHRGLCGSDPIRIIAGGDQLNPPQPGEADTLEDICGLDPSSHRLACMTHAHGAAEIEIVDE